jgi:hypothetical protein
MEYSFYIPNMHDDASTNVHNEVFPGYSSFINEPLDGCTYTFELVSKTGISSGTKGSLQIDDSTGMVDIDNFSSEKVTLGAAILITN